MIEHRTLERLDKLLHGLARSPYGEDVYRQDFRQLLVDVALEFAMQDYGCICKECESCLDYANEIRHDFGVEEKPGVEDELA